MRARTLRTQMLALLLGLLAAVCAVVSVSTDLTLRRVLLNRLDTQLQLAGGRTSTVIGFGPPADRDDRGPHGGAPGQPGRPAQPPPVADALRGQGPGTLVARIGAVSATGIVSTDTGGTVPLSTTDLAVAAGLPTDGDPHSLDLTHTDYRAVAVQVGDDRYITALPTAPVRSTVLQLAVIELVVSLVALLLAAVAGAALVRLALRGLHRVSATARRAAEVPLDRGEVALVERVPDPDPRTEVGQVGVALNTLLGHVSAALTARQASESRLRQFAADASHELRTPLASIRGYAELSRRTGEPVPAPVAHAMQRIESEAVRMTSLVEDLLLLARLDAGRPLAEEPVDLSRLLIDAVGDAHAAGPDHVWRLDLPDDPVVVPGDPARLHQVVANLLANARTHTPAGTTVTARVDPQGSRTALLTVLDDGPGVPVEVLPEVFERFSRADTSRARTAGSTGLGLAIVEAVVQAHSGRVHVTSRPGHTAFQVELPVAPVAPVAPLAPVVPVAPVALGAPAAVGVAGR